MLLKNFSLLFVEDDLITQEQMKMLLEEDCKTFFQAYNGKDAIDLYNKENPDIVITDINLPFLSGLELAKIIKEKDIAKPIIILSAHDNKDNILNSINLGSDGFIAKPIDIELLYERLNAIAKTLQNNLKTKSKIEKLHNLAYHDPLTQLTNRRFFDQEIDKLLQKAKTEPLEFSLLFIDINDFKNINENYGHKVGDMILQDVAKNITNSLFNESVISRRNGDEFLILVKNYTSSEHLKQIVYQISKATSSSIKYQDSIIHYSCSIGVAQFPQDSKEKSELLSLADQAMYNAKNSGKGNYFFACDNANYIQNNHDKTELLKIAPNFFWHKKYQQLFLDDKEIILTKKELLLLSLLFNKANYQASYEEITFYLWGDPYLEKKENIKTLIKTLRKKLPYNCINNIFGIGYKISFQSED